MNDQKVISRKNLPIRSPLVLTLLAYLMLDKLNASDLICGIFICLGVIVWIVFFVQVFKENQIDIFQVGK